MKSIFATLVLALLLASPCVAQDDSPKAEEPKPAPWIAEVGGASGVVVHPSGYILTAQHVVQRRKTLDVKVNGVAYSGKVVYDGPYDNIDEAAVLKIDAKDLEYVSCADAMPVPGDRVWTCGFPGGNFAKLSGKVIRVGDYDYKSPGVRVKQGIECDFWALPGNSGGPLFNSEGLLIGLCNAGSDRGDKPWSGWVGLASLKAAFRNNGDQVEIGVPQARRVVVYVFSRNDGTCPPCTRMHNEIPEGPLAGTRIIVKYVSPDDKELVARACAATGKEWPERVPLTWVEGSNKWQVGYTTRSGFLDFLRFCVVDIPVAVFEFIASSLGGSPQPEPQPIPAPGGVIPPIAETPTEPEGDQIAEAPTVPTGGLFPPTPEDLARTTDLDLSGIEVVILANDFLDAPAGLLEVLEKNLTGPAEARLNSLSDGKATLYLVPKRVQPDRYNATLMASRASCEKLRAIAIIPETNQNVVTAALLNMAEVKLTNWLANSFPFGVKIPLTIVFERTDEQMVEAIHAGLLTQESGVIVDVEGEPQPADDTVPWWYGLLAGLIEPLLAGRKKLAEAKA